MLVYACVERRASERARDYASVCEREEKRKGEGTKQAGREESNVPALISANRSMEYFLCEMNIIGTPGIFRMRRLRSLSQVATM